MVENKEIKQVITLGEKMSQEWNATNNKDVRFLF